MDRMVPESRVLGSGLPKTHHPRLTTLSAPQSVLRAAGFGRGQRVFVEVDAETGAISEIDHAV